MIGVEDPRHATLEGYCRLFETLAPDRIDELRALCTADVRFVDPFQEIVGIDRYVALYAHMFRTVTDPRFEVLDRALGATTGSIRWRFTGSFRNRNIAIDGMSELRFDPDTVRVSAHIDHWDAAGQVYARLPVVGAAIRALRRLFAAGV